MYLIDSGYKNKVIIIDPGEPNENKLISWLIRHQIEPIAVILTHEHFDHCIGVNNLNKYYDFDLIVSDNCATAIKSAKKNMSYYADIYCNPFTITQKCTIIQDNELITIGQIKIKCIVTEGHSSGSICLLHENNLFSGDTLLETRTPLKLPGSNRAIWNMSIDKIKQHNFATVYPGHGNIFTYIHG